MSRHWQRVTKPTDSYMYTRRKMKEKNIRDICYVCEVVYEHGSACLWS